VTAEKFIYLQPSENSFYWNRECSPKNGAW